MDRIKQFLLMVGMMLAVWLTAAPAQAADPSIRVVLPVGQVQQGDIIPAQIQIDSAGIQFNAAEAVLQYAPQKLAVVSVTREQSIFTLWPELPNWNSQLGEVQMSGGRPGGLYATNAAIATVYFRVLASGPMQLDFDLDRTAAYAHDGVGTRIPLTSSGLVLDIASDLVPRLQLVSTTHPTPEYWSHGSVVHVGWVVEADTEYSYAFSTNPETLPDDTPESEVGSVEFTDLEDGIYYFVIKQRAVGGPWSSLVYRRFLIDSTPPAPFMIELLDASLIDRTRAIAWNTTDDTSGVARYELTVGGKNIGTVTSPLTLHPDWRNQVLRISAIDAAGNITDATWEYAAVTAIRWNWWWLIGFLLLGGAVAFGLTRRRMRSR